MVYATRMLEKRQINSLLTAVNEQIRLVGNMTDAAQVTGLVKQTIARYASRTDENLQYWMGLGAVGDLQIMGGYPHVAQALAGLSGYSLFKNPALLSGELDLMLNAKMVAQMGELMTDFASSLANDGKISAAEITDKNMIEEWTRFLTFVASVLEILKERVASDE